MIDRVKVVLKSGKGGDGKVAFLHERGRALGGPAGGNGGRGGSIYVRADKRFNTLSAYRFGRVIKAQDGEGGHEKNMYGKDAPDVYLNVPVGTVVKDFETGALLADLSEDQATYLACKGGRGGKGNHCFATATRKAPKFAETGFPGETRTLYFELRLLADCGLVGLPNAGKSTLLSASTNADPKIADYPFTTLEPQLGVVDLSSGESFAMADLPGLIEGAHSGRGLGLSFLRHIERCRVLIHLVDITSDDPYGDFENINRELESYSLGLLNRPMVVGLNKIDLLTEEEVSAAVDDFKKKDQEKHSVFPISNLYGTGVKPMLREVYNLLQETPPFPMSETLQRDKERVYTLREEDLSETVPFTVRKLEPGVYEIAGTVLVNRARRIGMDGEEHLDRILALLEEVGVDQRLHEIGVEDGATIKVGEVEFNYSR